ncbi:SRPBCC family protein [Pseudoalteromonas sp. SMS1]|uniref:SRPBCC family protein n=1 Tax=Pseudoalteromonas sp. SMS1 TaxID=2908894 RepID=UPI001F256AE3|nr:SRPBCC family protein [Pseudoalteromonas sp. SMS1]MCF2856870.1 SRPBCC family protein [Pseudoalteromonas sp. SMS1]
MNVHNKQTINAPVSQVWTIIAEEFATAYKWMSGVVHSYEINHGLKGETPVAGRVCNLENHDNPFHAVENILRYDEAARTLVFEVIPVKERGPQLPIVKNKVTIRLTSTADGNTLIHWHSQVTLKLVGKLLYPILKLGLYKAFANILLDLKVFVETGYPSQRKVNSDKKLHAIAP